MGRPAHGTCCCVYAASFQRMPPSHFSRITGDGHHSIKHRPPHQPHLQTQKEAHLALGWGGEGGGAPEGFRWKMVLSSRYFSGTTGLMTCSMRSAWILSLVTSGECCVEIRMVCTRMRCESAALLLVLHRHLRLAVRAQPWHLPVLAHLPAVCKEQWRSATAHLGCSALRHPPNGAQGATVGASWSAARRSGHGGRPHKFAGHHDSKHSPVKQQSPLWRTQASVAIRVSWQQGRQACT